MQCSWNLQKTCVFDYLQQRIKIWAHATIQKIKHVNWSSETELSFLDQRLCSIWNIEKMLQFYVIFKGIYKVWGKWRILWRHNALPRCRIMLRFVDTWSPTLQVIKTAFATYTECFWFFQNISGPNKAQSGSCSFIWINQSWY